MRAIGWSAACAALLAAGCGDDSSGGPMDLASASDGPRDLGQGPVDLAARDFATTPADLAGAGVAYPLKVSANGRYLVDQNGAPFLIAGDAPQSLIVNLSMQEADSYYADRVAHGFNTLWINLVADDYTGGRPDGSTFDGILPFANGMDLTQPNEAYFQRADQLLTLAAQHGLNVLLDPCETGGFLNAMLAAGTTGSRGYGQFVGARYQGYDNILWMSGNDFQGWSDGSNDAVVLAVAQGILDKDSRHLHTTELDYPVSMSQDDARWAPILGMCSAYTYYPTYAEVLKAYGQPKVMPVFMVEAVYEYESNLQANVSSPSTLRREEYWSNLSGATGQVYGNHYTWTFAAGWQGMIDGPGALQMPNVKALFEPRRWWELVPDQGHAVLTAGYGTFSASGYVDDNDYATAARTPDGKLVMAYLPTMRTVTIAMSQLAGAANARWYDPSRGTFTGIQGSPFANAGSHDFSPPGPNGDGDPDWVLVLEAP